MDDCVQTVEIIKQPGQTLGFYIREGNGVDRWNGVFVSRIAQGSVVAKNSLLRVNDEILTVNTIDVQRMSLDDVVILMSIAKRLVLTIRINKNSKPANHLDHAEVISPREQAVREGRQPVVILKSGFNSSAYNDMSVDERLQEKFYTSSNCLNPNIDKQILLPSSKISDVYGTLPRYNVPFINTSSMQSLSPKQVIMSSQQGNIRFSSQFSGYSPTSMSQYFKSEITPENEVINKQQPALQLSQHRRAPSDQHYELGYRSDEWLDARGNISESGLLPSEKIIDRASLLGNTKHLQRAKVSPNGQLCQKDQYNSDSEATPQYHKSRNRYKTQLASVTNNIEQNKMLLNSMTLCRASNLARNRTSGSFADLSSARLYCEPDQISHESKNNPYQTNNSLTYSQGNYNMWLNHQLLQYCNEIPAVHNITIPISSHYSLQQRVQPQLQNYRLTRKLSTDSLLDYKTYQMTEPTDYATYRKGDNRLGSWISSGTSFAKSSRTSSNLRQRPNILPQSKTKTQSVTLGNTLCTSSSNQSCQKTNASGSTASKHRNNQLSRVPIKIQTEQFLSCPGAEISSNIVPLTGRLKINVMCGHGLKSTKTALRDLYCVIEIDSMPVARTMVRTGALNFDWDEMFDIDIIKSHKLQFLVYSWDPDTRHQLCFTATAPISYVVTQIKNDKSIPPSLPIKLAIKLDPKGTLYVEFTFIDIHLTLQRLKSNKKNGLFGVELKEIINREKSGLNVPLLVQRCVNEIEKRGVGQLGLYRLSGSMNRKQQLIDDFEKNVRMVDLGPDGVSDVNVFTS